MRTFATVQGLPVVHTETGYEYGRVIDALLLDNHITGLLINMKGWLNRHQFLQMQHIFSIGEQAVMVQSETCFETCHSQPIYQESIHLVLGKPKLRGMELFSVRGDLLGLVEDVYFSDPLGMIEGYKVTDGLLADLTKGQHMLQGHHLVIGKERAILS
ncbi:PRC-barrel domain-containing protein [Alkalicoccobacillus porphyridii]|uniref:PRC-barrel domain-containing protein n=1 Tax=Alkalicoccobacillus porphyridii TaxID=2597270 RepID=UPI00163DE5F8|nr:PRC-barrel domain-containing protein [Alkalicoccobacillus porphyridii]